MAAYQKFGQEHAAAIRGGAVLHPTATRRIGRAHV